MTEFQFDQIEKHLISYFKNECPSWATHEKELRNFRLEIGSILEPSHRAFKIGRFWPKRDTSQGYYEGLCQRDANKVGEAILIYVEKWGAVFILSKVP